MSAAFEAVKGFDDLGRVRWRGRTAYGWIVHTWDTYGDMGPCVHRFKWTALAHARYVAKENSSWRSAKSEPRVARDD